MDMRFSFIQKDEEKKKSYLIPSHNFVIIPVVFEI